MNMIKTANTLWTASDAAHAAGGDAHPDWKATGVSINTRTLQPGDLFIALQGPNVDGHDYVADAFEKGAAAATVHHRPPVLDPDAPLLVVEDTMKALEDLGMEGRKRLDQGKVIAVTGSVGKTGVKEALKLVLGDQGKTSASVGSLNNHWGLPLSLARIPADADYAVLEMGMNHPGELTQLSKMGRPHVCVITTIAPAHTEFFKDTFEIADAKAEIFAGAEPGATAVLNLDIPEFERLHTAAQNAGMETVITFGVNVQADFRVIAYELDGDGSLVTAVTPVGTVTYRVGSPGLHWVLNSLCVLAAVHAAGGDVARAGESLTEMSPPSGRGARFEIARDGGAFQLIDESYNASPAAMRAAMAVLVAQPVGAGGRRIVALGDMLEMGENSPRMHAELAEAIDANGIDLAFLAGTDMKHLWDVLPESKRGHFASDSEALAEVMQSAVRPGDVVMVKGSAGTKMGRVVDALKQGEG